MLDSIFFNWEQNSFKKTAVNNRIKNIYPKTIKVMWKANDTFVAFAY